MIKKTYKGALKSYLTKTHRIKELIKKDYYAELENIKQRTINDKVFYFNEKDKEPYKSFSSLTKGTYGDWIPSFALDKAAQYGNNLMENIENYYLSNGDINKVENEKDQKIFEAFLKFLFVEKLEIISVEKFFINPKTNEYGFIDLFVKDKNGKIILIEIKTRNDLNISNITKAQAYFYKRNFENVMTWILQINRKTFEYKVEKLQWQEAKKYLNIIEIYNNPEQWNDIKITQKKNT